MRDSEELCTVCGVPKHLHTNGRASKQIDTQDVVYMRHPALPDKNGYLSCIPGHDHFTDQSVNSDLLNEGGEPADVLINIKTGEIKHGYQYAKLPVEEILRIRFFNENTRKYDKNGKLSSDGDEFSFEVFHDPDVCMYPHCIIKAYKNGTEVKQIKSATIKTTIRDFFAQIAEAERLKCES